MRCRRTSWIVTPSISRCQISATSSWPLGTTGGACMPNVTPLTYASLSLLGWLVDTLADRAGVSRLDVITDMRQAVHDWEAENLRPGS